MRELPILFKTEMVRAILSGQKTQTRRLKGLKVVNENPDEWSLYSNKLKWNVAGKRQFWFERKIKPICRGKWIDQQAACTGGDQLWVKETWQEEVDALSPKQLEEIVTNHVIENMDFKKYKDVKEREEKEDKKLAALIGITLNGSRRGSFPRQGSNFKNLNYGKRKREN